MDALLFHPKMVHVPIALAVLMPLVAGGLVVAWWRNWLPGRTWIVAVLLQTILLGSGLLALRSGEIEEHRIGQGVPKAAIEAHEEAAELFVWASGGVLAVMLTAAAFRSRRLGLPIATAGALATIAVLALGYRTGQAGGSLVFEHGAAQAYTRAAASGPTSAVLEGDRT